MRDLTPRMVQVIELVGVKRLTYSDAAQRMGLSEHTVRHYARQVRERVGSERPPRETLIDVAHDGTAA